MEKLFLLYRLTEGARYNLCSGGWLAFVLSSWKLHVAEEHLDCTFSVVCPHEHGIRGIKLFGMQIVPSDTPRSPKIKADRLQPRCQPKLGKRRGSRSFMMM